MKGIRSSSSIDFAGKKELQNIVKVLKLNGKYQ